MSKVYVKNIKDIIFDVNTPVFNDTLKYKPSRKESSLAYQLLFRVALEEYNIDLRNIKFSYNEHGKPMCDEFYFNISHSKDYIAVAISDKEIGVDIQFIDMNKDYHLLAKKLNIEGKDNKEILTNYSILEAYLKKKGTGIYGSLISNNNYPNTHMIIDNDYVLSVCAEDEVNIVMLNN